MEWTTIRILLYPSFTPVLMVPIMRKILLRYRGQSRKVIPSSLEAETRDGVGISGFLLQPILSRIVTVFYSYPSRDEA